MTYLTFIVGIILIPRLLTNYMQSKKTYATWKTRLSQTIIRSELAAEKGLSDLTGFIHRSSRRWSIRLCELSTRSDVFYGIFGYMLYIITLPWFLGDFVPSNPDPKQRWGWYFIYGILFSDGTWVPLLDTWGYGNINLGLLTNS